MKEISWYRLRVNTPITYSSTKQKLHKTKTAHIMRLLDAAQTQLVPFNAEEGCFEVKLQEVTPRKKPSAQL